MGTIKDRKGRDLVEEEKNKRWNEYMEEQKYKTDLNEPDNHTGVLVTQSQMFWRVKSNGP